MGDSHEDVMRHTFVHFDRQIDGDIFYAFLVNVGP